MGEELKSAFHNLSIPGLSQIPVLGKLLFQYNWMVYFAIVLALAMNHFLRETRLGLNLRAVGEDPAAADAAGIDTTRYQYTAVIIGGGICGIGGMYMCAPCRTPHRRIPCILPRQPPCPATSHS